MSSFRTTLISLFMVIFLLVNIGHATDLQQAQSTMDRYLSEPDAIDFSWSGCVRIQSFS